MKTELASQDGSAFHTTHWGVVMAAGEAASSEATQALESLCGTYWYPIYVYVRSRGYSPEDAQDLTQEFLAHLVTTQALRTVHPAKGRFRSFILASVNHFLANERDKAQAQKRGGGATFISLDDAETRYRLEPSDGLLPERIFESQWALALLAQVAVRLRGEYHATSRGALYEALQVYLTPEKGLPPYREAAGQLGLTVDALKKSVERLRRRYGQLLREEIGHTVAAPAEVDEEICHLRFALGAR